MLLSLHRWLPGAATITRREQVRSAAGALLGMLFTALLSPILIHALPGHAHATLLLIAPIGASSVLLFALPASPLAQPWAVIGGNVLSGLVGVACVRWLGPVLPGPVLGALACAAGIGAMFLARCLHPPGGAVALSAVLGGPAVQAAGFAWPLVTVLLNSLLVVAAALLYSKLTGRRYPQPQQISHANPHTTADAVPTARLGFTPDDLEAVLRQHNQLLDISRDDLETLILQTEQRAYHRRFGVIRCADIMSRDVVSAEFGTSLAEAWRRLRAHRVGALPVLNRAGRVIGIVTQTDFLELSALDDPLAMRAQLQHFLRQSGRTHAEKPEVVGQIMTDRPVTVQAGLPIAALVPLMADSGHHHIPVVDAAQRFVGIITQSDLVAALYETGLAEAAR